jgi:hypothetical protein
MRRIAISCCASFWPKSAKLEHHREHPVEVTRPVRALEDLADAAGAHRDDGFAARVEVVHIRGVDQVNPLAREEGAVRVQGAGVALKVDGVVEL